MKIKTFIVLVPVDLNDDARRICEHIENMNFVNRQDMGIAVQEEIIEYQLKGANNLEVMPITDFMDRVNDQEFNDENFFISYVNQILN